MSVQSASAASWLRSISPSSVLSRASSSTLTWMRQMRALQWKLLIQLSKQLRVSLTVLFLPLLAVLLILGIRAVITNLNDANSFSPAVSHLPFTADVSPCQALNTLGNPDPSSWCTSLVYAPSNAFTDEVMATVAAGLPGWSMGRDVLGFPTANALYLDWARQLGHRDVAVVFTNTTYQYWQGIFAAVGPNQVAYQLKWNTTRVSNDALRTAPNSDPLRWRVATLQFLLESALSNAIARNVSQAFPLRPGQPVPYRALPVAQASDLEFQFVQQPPSSSPYPPSPSDDSITATLGGPLFVMGAAITALLLIQLVAAEKQDSLLAMMRMSQLHESAYWASYLLTFAVLTLPAALVATGTGVLLGMQNFVHAAFSIHFIALWLLLIAMSGMGLLVAALWTQPRWVNLFSFLFLALCVMATFYFSTNAYYSIQQPSGQVFLTGLLPFFHYGRIWSDIVRHSSYQTGINLTVQASWQQAAVNQSGLQYPLPYVLALPRRQQDFAWSDIYAPQLVISDRYYCNPLDSVCCNYWQSVGQSGVCFYSRSTQFSLWMLLLLAVAYTTAAWWLSQVSNDRGGGKPVYFPIRPQHWMETRRHERHSAEEEDNERQALADERDLIARERRLSAHEGSIRTLKLSKAYDQRTAVKELTIAMQPGSVTCLLGPNGAGKSSVVNVLSGLLRPTFGEAFVCGYSVREDLSHIHALIGVCPQDSLLYPQLSVVQHMRLLSALRGVPSSAVEETVKRSLKLVNLWVHRLKRVDELSGGMKRRLCLALALVGEPPVLLLDECTSGLDPMHKVELWTAVQRLKRDRVVLLTTHSLAEAEFLADQVALLSDGRLVAQGSPAELRHHYGLGYQLQLLVSPQHANLVVRHIRRYITSPEVLGAEGGAIVVGLKRHQLPELLAFMDWACNHRPPPEFEMPHYPGSPSAASARDNGRHRSVIREWSLQQSTLEEVFLRFCNREQTVNSAHMLDSERRIEHLEADEKQPGGDAERQPPSPATPVSPSLPAAVVSPAASYRPSDWDQVRSVVLKNWAMLRSERRSWLARLLVLVAVLLLLIYLVLNGGRSNICSQGYSSQYLPCDPQQFANQFFVSNSQLYPLDVQVLPYQQQQGFTVPVWMNAQDAGSVYYNARLAFVDTQNGSGTPFASWDFGQGVRGVVNVTAVQWQNAQGNFTFSNTTFADWAPLLAANGATDVAEQAFLNELLVLSHANDSLASRVGPCLNYNLQGITWWFTGVAQAQAMSDWLYPNTALRVANSSIGLAGDGSRLAYRQVFWTNEPSQMQPSTAGNFSNQGGTPLCQISTTQFAGFYSSQVYSTVHGLSNAMLYTTINASSSYVAAQLQLGLHPWRQSAAPVVSGTLLGTGNLNFPGGLDANTLAYCVGLMAFVLMLLLPAFCDRILYERESQLFFMQRLAGLRVRNYWLASYAFDSGVAWVWSVCVVVLGYAMGLGLFVRSDVGLWFVLLLVWNHVQVGLAWLCAALFSRRRLAGIALHVLVMLVVVYATLMERYITGTLVYPKALLVFPPFAFVRALSLVIRDSGGLAALSAGSELSLALVALLLVGSGFMALGWLLHTLQYRSLLSLLEQLPCYRGKRWQVRQEENEVRAQQRMTVANQSLLSPASHRALREDEEQQASDAPPAEEVDEDVQRESERVRQLARAGSDEAQQDAAVLIVGLRKKYDKLGPMRLLRRCLGATNDSDDQRRVDAVQELDLAIAYGECLALLGPNGAGKSTLLSVLSGLLLPSSGRALINGHDVSHELPQVYSSLGICPQHDRLYDDLTTRQHLLFYARLKGVPRSEERAAVYRLAKRVQLDGDAFDSKIRELSGGMRRRLSIAISLVGDPLVWMLDEPSTGLSAEARRSVWDIVSQQKQQRRCTLITTHMMEEADTLSTRVAILVKGRLRCIGPVAHLKQRFAQQLTLSLTVEEGQPMDVDPSADAAQLHAVVAAGQAGAYLQRLLRFVREEISEHAELRAVQGQRLLFTLRLDGSEAGAGGQVEAAAQLRSVLPVFQRLAERQQRLRSELSVLAWDVSQASLDDVFVETVRRAKADSSSQQDDELEL